MEAFRQSSPPLAPRTGGEISPLDPRRLMSLPARSCGRSVIRIGVSGNLGGHTRELCAACAVAAEMWLARTMSECDVELVWAEDSFDGARTREAACRLVDSGVVAIIGHLASSAALAAASVYRRAELPFLAPGASHPALTSAGHWNVLRLTGRDEDLAVRMADVAIRLGCQAPGVVEQKNAHGHSLGRLLSRRLRELGLDVRHVVLDRAPEAMPRRAFAGTDALLLAGTYEMAVRLLTWLDKKGYTGRTVLSDDAFTPELPLRAHSAAAEALVVSTPLVVDHPEHCGFRRAYVRRTGLPPGAYSASSFVAMSLLLEELEMLKSKGAKAFMKTVKSHAPRASLLGPLRFLASGDVADFNWATYQVADGGFVPVRMAEEEYRWNGCSRTG